MNAKRPEFLRYYIRVMDVKLFNALVASAEKNAARGYEAVRSEGYYVIRTNDEVLWKELYLYGQMLAQAQGAYLEAGQD
jgi:hypothetical protein